MLSKEDNQLLTQTGPGTPMGDMFRRYWIPALQTEELEKDGKPKQVKLLGEDLVAFRDTNGKVGLIDERCPHRGTSLYFGINDGRRGDVHGNPFGRKRRKIQTIN
jgi:hypothetical protein